VFKHLENTKHKIIRKHASITRNIRNPHKHNIRTRYISIMISAAGRFCPNICTL